MNDRQNRSKQTREQPELGKENMESFISNFQKLRERGGGWRGEEKEREKGEKEKGLAGGDAQKLGSTECRDNL